MLNLKVCCFALLLAAALAEQDSTPTLITSATKTPKVQVTRTSLHVARSLDPEAMQTLEVRTRTGDVATLIVKKRDGKSAPLGIPEPVSIRSSSVRVLEEPNEQRAVSGDDAIKVIEPPAREEKMIRVPAPTYVRSSSVFVKGEQQQTANDGFWKRGRSVMHIDSDGIPVITGVRMPDDESDRQTWRNARVINGVLVPYDTTTSNPASEDDKTTKPTILHHVETSPTPAQENKKGQSYDYPYSQYTHQRILDYINTVNQRETESRNQVRAIRGRMIHYPEPSSRSDKETDRSEARVLHYPGTSIYPTSLLYTPPSSKTSRISFEEGVRTPILQYAHPELGVQPAKVTTKQDEEEEKVNENRYNNKNNNNYRGLTLAYFSQDIHSDRSPFAYEPGLEMVEETTEAAATDRRSTTSGENLNDLHGSIPKNSRAYLYQQQPSDDYGLATDKYIKRYPYNSLNSYSEKDNYNRYKGDAQIGQGYGRYPYGNGYYKVQITKQKPFWERISETIRDHVQNGMEKVSDLTRPVVDPLVEATQKISQNLGLGEHNPNVIQDKVGNAVAAYPVLLPALGLVAGGAALGLGAVAVGRYLDVDMLKKRSGEKDDEDDDSDLEMEHKRALESVIKALMERENAREGGGNWVVAEEFKNPEVQIKVLENAARSLSMQQKTGVQDQAIESQIKAIEKIVSKLRHGQKKEDNQWVIVEETTQQENNEPANIRSPKKQKDDEEDRWILVKSIAPPKRQRSLEEEGMWVIADGQNEDSRARTIESIVQSLDERNGQNKGNWVVASSNDGTSEDWIAANSRSDKESIKNKRSSDDVIFVVEEDPNQARVARQAEMNLGLTEPQLYHILENLHPHHRVVKRSQNTDMEDIDFLLFNNRREADHRVVKRTTSEGAEDYLNNILQTLDYNQQETTARFDAHPQDWSNTPCAKRIFCDVMVKQPADSVLQMEKKMATFLSLIQPNESVSYHLHDVMEAVKRQDCSQFQCHQRAAIDIPLHGPGPR